MEAPSATKSLQDFVKCPVTDFKFAHLLLNHRVQWYMMNCMLQRLKKKDVADLDEMWKFYRTLFDIHSSVEEEKMLPILQSGPSESIASSVHAEHEDLIKSLKEVEEAKSKPNDEFEAKLKVFAKKYHQHTLTEEKNLIPACQSLDEAKRSSMTAAIRDFFRAQPDNAWLILSMRDIALSSGDQDLWENSMPWFFKNVVAPFLGLNATFSRYSALFPPSKGWLAEYTALLNA